MPRLRVDPWDPEYGGSVELEEASPPDVDLGVEEGPWEARSAPSVEPPRCVFVDGVRRIDLRLYAEEGDAAAPALAGSWAVGAAWASGAGAGSPRIDQVRVGRSLVVGGGLSHPGLAAEVGGEALRYESRTVAGGAPADPLHGLQNQMREAEASLASEIVDAGGAELVVFDGPLSYVSAEGLAATGPAVGFVKRQSQPYLPPDRSGILGALRPGQRTPLFRIVRQRLGRYAWYLRLADRRSIDGVMTGIVRMEALDAHPVEEALRLADLAAAALPGFASRIGRDPRAPQNLYPVGRLESVLRHRLGDQQLLRRALEAAVWTEAHDE